MPVHPPLLRARRGLLALAAVTPLLVSSCSVSRLVAAVTPTGHYRRTDGLPYGDGKRRRLDLYATVRPCSTTWRPSRAACRSKAGIHTPLAGVD